MVLIDHGELSVASVFLHFGLKQCITLLLNKQSQSRNETKVYSADQTFLSSLSTCSSVYNLIRSTLAMTSNPLKEVLGIPPNWWPKNSGNNRKPWLNRDWVLAYVLWKGIDIWVIWILKSNEYQGDPRGIKHKTHQFMIHMTSRHDHQEPKVTRMNRGMDHFLATLGLNTSKYK